MVNHSIFINHHRSDVGRHGYGLYEYRNACFGYDCVFFDRSTSGRDDELPDKRHQSVERYTVLLALIGPEWLDIRDKGYHQDSCKIIR
jgi:hypothetical protein